ncbi:MAG: hypothetical protein JJ975_12505 [Bacteroidia bacterium]|nr:hypothetical protein [Bacteroidia bacterium]
MSSAQIPEDRLTLYDNLIARFSQFERKGKTTPYTSTNTYMFTFLAKDGSLALRLSQEQQTEFKEKHNAQNMEQHGRVMKDFIAVPEELMSDIDLLEKYVELSYQHTQGLTPKKKK